MKNIRRAVAPSSRHGIAVGGFSLDSLMRATRGLGTLALGVALAAAPLRAEVIDRILAVVNGSIVTLSDVRGAMRLGLVEAPPTGPALQGVRERLIERRLTLMEVERYAPPEPPAEKIDARVAATRARFAAAAEFEGAMAESGLMLDELRRHHRDDLRIDAYLQQRFGAALQPTDEDLTTHYRAHEAAFTRGGELRPFDEVRDEVRAALIAERREALIRDWIAGLRRRADIIVLPS
jgi:hypothetical protein